MAGQGEFGGAEVTVAQLQATWQEPREFNTNPGTSVATKVPGFGTIVANGSGSRRSSGQWMELAESQGTLPHTKRFKLNPSSNKMEEMNKTNQDEFRLVWTTPGGTKPQPPAAIQAQPENIPLSLTFTLNEGNLCVDSQQVFSVSKRGEVRSKKRRPSAELLESFPTFNRTQSTVEFKPIYPKRLSEADTVGNGAYYYKFEDPKIREWNGVQNGESPSKESLPAFIGLENLRGESDATDELGGGLPPIGTLFAICDNLHLSPASAEKYGRNPHLGSPRSIPFYQ